MNMLVASFWEGLVHATGFALLGIVVYLALRRWSPAAGALAAGSSLGVMAMVAILAFCPWPRWVTGQLARDAASGDREFQSPGALKRGAMEVPATRPDQVAARSSPAAEGIASQPLSAEKPRMAFGVSPDPGLGVG